jgi:RND family efflux transporter MFP subunit
MPFSRSPGVVAFLLCMPLAACDEGSRADPPAPSESAPREVRVALVQLAPWERSVPAVGQLEPFERVLVATKVPGRLAELRADRGDRVRRGEVVAMLESREYEMRVRASEAAVAAARALLGLSEGADDALEPESTSAVRLARAELDRARLDRERTTALAREGVDSQAVSDTAEADHRAAESRLQEAFELVAARRATLAQRRAELEIARSQLEETRIEAPFDGQVMARMTGPGAYLAVGDPLLELVRTDPLRLVLSVGERDGSAVRAGQDVRARVEGYPSEIAGTVARLAPSLADGSRSLVVEVDVPDPEARLRAGLFAEARIVVAPDESVPVIPAAALVSFAGLDKAFVVREGKTEERRLTLGRREPARVEVLSGLAAGEEVVLSPGKLGGGETVRVVR